MKLHTLQTSPYARKILVLALETGLFDRLELVDHDVWDKDTEISRVNPLGKVPAMILDDGELMIDSPVMCEYLDALHVGPGLIPPSGPARRMVLRLQSFADGALDAAVLKVVELRRRPVRQSAGWIARQTRAVANTLDMMEEEVAGFDETLDLGKIALGCALGYLDFRLADDDWRAGRPKLAGWFEEFSQRNSMKATVPLERS